VLRAVRHITAITVFLIVLSFASIATAAPVAWDNVDITLHTEQARTVLMVSGTLADSATLPAEVELSVPAGGEIQWAGEILGGPVENDPKVAYTKSEGDGFDLYRFTLTKSRTAQIETALTGVSSFDGTTYGTTLRWIPSQDVPSVRISARVQAGAKIAEASPGATLLPGDAANAYYSKTIEGAKAGTPVDLTFTYTLPGVGQAPAASDAGSSDVVPVVILSVLAVGGLALMAFGVQRKLAAKGAAREAEEAAARPVPKGTKAAARTSGAKAQAVTDAPEEPAAAKSGLRPQHVVTGALVLMLAVAVFVMARQATSSAFVNGTLTRSFGGASACTAVKIPLTPKPGVDFEKDAGKLMDALAGLESLGQVTIALEPPSIDVAYCESTITEQQVRDRLESAGIVTLGAGVVQSSDAATPSVTTTPAP